MDKRIVIGIIVACVVLLGGGIFLASRNNPTSSGEENTKLLEVTNQDMVKGSKDAQVTLVEYSDFQCPSCAAYYPIIEQLVKDYPTQLRLVYRHFPLTSIHANAWSASTFSQAAANQGKFWEVYAKLFENQKAWSDAKNTDAEFSKYAKEVGLDWEKAKTDMYSESVINLVRAQQKSGEDLGVNATPTFYVNGENIVLPGGLDQFKKIIEGEMAKTQTSDKIHIHADLAVFSDDGKMLDYSNERFMEKHVDIHFHDGNGKIIHIHKKGATLGQLFTSLGESIPTQLEWAVNGKRMTTRPEEYVVADLDQIVIGTNKLSDAQIKQVEDKACIYSETCPERGKPPTENCVGGLGTDCIDEDK